jgi:hypothetical protein
VVLAGARTRAGAQTAGRATLALVGSLVCATVAYAVESCGPAFDGVTSGNPDAFVLYEALLYRGAPDLSALGIDRLVIVDRDIWTDSGPQGPPDPDRVAQFAARLGPVDQPTVLDFEQFPLTGDPAVVTDSLARKAAIVAAFRRAAPERRYGHYAAPPIRDYWRAIALDRHDPKFRAWQAENDRLKPLESDADVLFPSLYTFYEDREGWRRFAIAQICEARRISRKPVIVFLWPEYHPSNTTLAGRFLDGSYFRMQLELVRRYADGAVLWGGYDLQSSRPRDWDEQAAWWQETRDFARRLRPP